MRVLKRACVPVLAYFIKPNDIDMAAIIQGAASKCVNKILPLL